MGVVLILDAHSRAGIETIQALGSKNIEIHASSDKDNCLAFKSRYVNLQFKQPDSVDSHNFLNWLQELTSKYSYSLIVPSTEIALQVFLDISDTHEIKSKAVLPSKKSLEITLDKFETYLLASKYKLLSPQTSIVDKNNYNEAPTEFPVILKSTHSVKKFVNQLHEYSTKIIYNKDEWNSIVEKWLPVTNIIQQEYIFGKGIGIEILYKNGKMIWSFAHERIHENPLTGGASTYRKSIPMPKDLLVKIRSIFDELIWHGVAMVEFKQDIKGNYWLMEINPRLWGSVALSIDAGVNFPFGLYQIATDQILENQPTYRRNYYTRDFASDLDWQKENIKADHENPYLLTKPRILSVLEYTRIFLLNESWDHFNYKDLGVTVEILRNSFQRQFHFLINRLRLVKQIFDIKRTHRKLITNMNRVEHILIICYGNICRSPFAEKYIQSKNVDIKVKSTGFFSTERRPSPYNILKAAADMNLNLSVHSSTKINSSMVENADLILVMDIHNYNMLIDLYPRAKNRTTLLGLFVDNKIVEIHDPYSLTNEPTKVILNQISAAADGFMHFYDKSLFAKSRRSQLVTQVLSEDEFLKMEMIWNDLVEKSDADHMFMNWAWLSTWWEQWSEKQSLRLFLLATYTKENQLVGLAPLYKHTRHIYSNNDFTQIQFIGSSWGNADTVRTEYIDFIVDNRYGIDVRKEFLSYLEADDSWGQLIIADMDKKSLTYNLLSQSECFKNSYKRIVHEDNSTYINTSGPYDEFLSNLGRNTRYNAFNRRKYLETLGEVKIEFASGATIDNYFSDLNDLHNIRWNRHCFSGDALEFHKRLAKGQHKSGNLRFSVITLSGTPISLLYNIVANNREYNIQAGFNDQLGHKLSLGLLHIGYAIELAIQDKQITCLDLLAGPGKNSYYKTHFSNNNIDLVTIQFNRKLILKISYKIFDMSPVLMKRIATKYLINKLKRIHD